MATDTRVFILLGCGGAESDRRIRANTYPSSSTCQACREAEDAGSRGSRSSGCDVVEMPAARDFLSIYVSAGVERGTSVE